MDRFNRFYWTSRLKMSKEKSHQFDDRLGSARVTFVNQAVTLATGADSHQKLDHLMWNWSKFWFKPFKAKFLFINGQKRKITDGVRVPRRVRLLTHLLYLRLHTNCRPWHSIVQIEEQKRWRSWKRTSFWWRKCSYFKLTTHFLKVKRATEFENCF